MGTGQVSAFFRFPGYLDIMKEAAHGREEVRLLCPGGGSAG